MNPLYYLHTLNLDDSDDFYRAMGRLEESLRFSSKTKIEEAVPAEMMEVFSDAQWPELLFEFQPSLRLFDCEYDLIDFRGRLGRGESPRIPEKQGIHNILVYRDQEGLAMRTVMEPEISALRMAMQGIQFSKIADSIWPRLEAELRCHKMTELVIIWLNSGLIIDAGVPIPEGAKYEVEQGNER